MFFFDFIVPSLNYIGAAICALQACLIWHVEEYPAVEKINQEERNTVAMKYAFRLCSGILMMLFQQFFSINVILTNLSDIMNDSGLDVDGKISNWHRMLCAINRSFHWCVDH